VREGSPHFEVILQYVLDAPFQSIPVVATNSFFAADGFLAQEEAGSRPTSPSESTDAASPKYVSKKIPPRIIQDAVGLAIFSCMRSGLWMSGSGGSGILIARKADGTWSPPSGIILHTAALGFTAGVDIYDCVLVINSVAALEVFTKPRITLGHDVDLTVGPLVTTGLLENDIRWKELEGTVLTYLKARGTHQHVPLVGSLVTERSNENERFYGGNVGVLDVLAGNIHKDIPETRPIFEVIKAAEGRTDYDAALMEELAQRPAPGDAILDSPTDKVAPMSPPRSPFGVPNADDPDPFGVIALEMAGLEIREAGTRLRPASSQFEFHPAPTSPLFSNFQRQSIDTYVSKSNRSNRESVLSLKSQGTQTEMTPETALSRNTSDDGQHEGVVDKLPTVVEPEEVDYTKIDLSALEMLRRKSSVAAEAVPVEVVSPQSKPSTVDHGSETDMEKKSSNYPTTDEEQDDDADDDADDEEDEEEYVSAGEEDDTVVYEIATATAPARAAIMSTQVTQVIQAKGALVTIPKRIPPPLPARSPARTSRASKSEIGDVTPLRSPLRTSFESEDVRSLRTATPTIEVNMSEETTETPLPVPDTKEASDDGFLESSTPAMVGHRKQPSSDVDPPDGKRSSIQITHSPPTPQIGGWTSSGDEQEQEPKTPRAHDETRPQSDSQHEKHKSKDDNELSLDPVDLPSP
jgi:lipid-binding SYLF domain-containing protein